MHDKIKCTGVKGIGSEVNKSQYGRLVTGNVKWSVVVVYVRKGS